MKEYQQKPHHDSAFPGENWFFYWKTSASLWESKIRDYDGINPIFAPINWSFHSIDTEKYDFGSNKPETDLKRLYELTTKYGKEIVFLLPLTPVPFLPNGGVPAHLARVPSISKEKIAYAIIDSEQQIHKLFSFYDPKIYQSFRKFVWNIGQFFSQEKIAASICPMRSGFIKNGQFNSYMDDTSSCFEEGLSRFLKQKQIQNKDIELEVDEEQHKQEFQELINELYYQSAQECIADRLEGEIVDFAFLGGKPDDIFVRFSESLEYEGRYFTPLFESIGLNLIPSVTLLPNNIKEGILARSTNDFVTSNFVKAKLDKSIFEDDFLANFSPLTLFVINLSSFDPQSSQNRWQELGLTSFLSNNYRWTHNYLQKIGFCEDEDQLERKIFFFDSKDLSEKSFSTVLQLFMNGAKICLNISGLTDQLSKRLELFLSENSIDLEKINFISQISNAKLGEGNLTLFNGDEIKKLSISKRISFWNNIISYFSIKHLQVKTDDDVFFFWKMRSPKTNELNFEEIRRICLYNPTSYKKKAQVTSHKNFAFLKYVNDDKTKVKSAPVGVDVELLPGGTVSLDFGFFE